MALAWREGTHEHAPISRGWRDVRLALGSVAATPIRARATEAVLEGRRRRPRPPTSPPRRWRASSTRSTTSARPPEYRRLVAARVLHRLIREVGGW